MNPEEKPRQEEKEKKAKKSQPRRTGQIIPRGKDKWLVSVFIGYNANGGNKYSAKTITGKRSEAEKYLRARLAELDKGEFVEPSTDTLNAYLDRWLETAAKPRLAIRTFEDYTEILTRYVREPLGAKKLSSIKALDLQALYTKMLEEKLSSRTIRYVHTTISSALKQAVKWKLIASNPAADCEIPRKERKEMRALDAAEAKRFLEAARDDRWGLVFRFALETGMRPEEYLGLQWRDIDLDRGTAAVQRTLCWRRKGRMRKEGEDSENGWYWGECKTAMSRRTLPLSAPLVNELKRHKEIQIANSRNFADPWKDLDLVFTMPLGAPINSDVLGSKYFKHLLKQAKVPDVRLYDLRHTMATLLLIAGENPKVVSERLGHASVTLTLDVYSHVLPSMQQSATSKLEGLLWVDSENLTNNSQTTG